MTPAHIADSAARRGIIDPFPRPVPCSADRRPDGGQPPAADLLSVAAIGPERRFDAQLIVGQVLGGCLVVGLVLSACGAQQQSGEPSGSGEPSAQPSSNLTGGTVRIGIGGSPDSLNPGNGLLAEAYVLYGLVHDTPIGINQAGEFVPKLATDWEVSADGLTWTMTIRDDAVFHDGTPVTAEDVAFSIQLYKDTTGLPVPALIRVVLRDHRGHRPHHGDIDHRRAARRLRGADRLMYVLPKHIWEDVEDPIEFQNREMIGPARSA